jgi:hypothetical protein
MFYFLLFFVAHFNVPNDRITSHPTLIAEELAITPTSNPLLPPTFGWLLCISIKWPPCYGRFFNYFFRLLIDYSKRRENAPPTRPAPVESLLKQPPSSDAIFYLIVAFTR